MIEDEANRTRGAAVNCEEAERLLVLYACDELDKERRGSVEQHVAQCRECAAVLAGELRLQQMIAARKQPADTIDPSGSLLAQCRSELQERLDDVTNAHARRGWLYGLRPSRWFVLHPALSAALLVVIGLVLGTAVPQYYRSRIAQGPGTAMLVSAPPRISDQDLQTMGVAGINWIPDSGSVELRLTAEKPIEVKGSLDDTDVRRVLTFVVQNGQRFDSGVRLESVDALRARSSDTEVRRALCAAVRKDRNPGVRLKALEALRGFEQDDLVRQTLLDALSNDSCPGVRVEAINSLEATLRAMAEKGSIASDKQLINVLRERMHKDPNNYIRMQSAAAIRELGPHETY